MNLHHQLHRVAKSILVQPQVNSLVRSMLKSKLLYDRLPVSQVERIPVLGKVPVALPDGQSFVMQTDGDDAIASLIFWHGAFVRYEPNTTKLFLSLVQTARTFLDIGANTGLYSLAAAAENPARQVVAFEPVPEVYAYLTRNIGVNRFTNVHAFAVAIGDCCGTASFYIPTSVVLPSGASTAGGLVPQCKEIQVAATTLDQFVAEHRIENVDLMKIDTETTEPQVLAGAINTLRTQRPAIICEVLPFGKEQQLHHVLDPLDYRYYWLRGQALVEQPTIAGDPTFTDMNYLFMPAERACEVRPA